MNHCESTRAFFDSVADKWDEMCQHDPEKIAAILTLANIKKNRRVLDIATGTGVLIPFLLKYEPEEVIAIDISEQMIAKAREKHRQNKVCFEVDNFYMANHKGFDFAIIYSAYPHFADKKAFVSKLAACLKSDGRFMIAHSESKETINGRHSGDDVKKVSSSLKDALTESNLFNEAFKIDIIVDTDELYVISGKKR